MHLTLLMAITCFAMGLAQTVQFIEPTFTQLDASFAYGKGNVSFSAAPVITLATGVAFGLVGMAGQAWLPDAFTWVITLSGVVSGAPTILLEGTLDGTNWYTIDTFNSTTSAMRGVSSVNLPTRVLGIRARLSVVGTGAGTATVTITA